MVCRHCYNGAGYCGDAIWRSVGKMRRIDAAQKDTIVMAILSSAV